MDNYRMGQT